MRKLAIFAFSFAAAAAAYVYLLSALWGLLLGGAILVVGIILCFFRTAMLKRFRIAAFGLALGLVWSFGYEYFQITPLLAYCGDGREITVQVCEVPEATDLGCAVTAKLDGGKLRLYLNTAAESVALGDMLTVTADVSDVLYNAEMENQLYYQSRDISLVGIQRGELRIVKAERLPVSLWPQRMAAAVKGKITAVFPDDAEGFAVAYLLGETDGLSYQTRNQMSISGISHVVAVSGLHLSVLLSALTLFVRRKRRLLACIAIPLLWIFAAMVGFTPSVTRAAVMHTLMLMAPIFHREYDMPTALGGALLLILVENPWAIANVSLQMSFAATAGILCFSGQINAWIMERLGMHEKKKHRLLRRGSSMLAASVATSLGAQVFTVPLVAVYFGQVSLIAPVSNLLLLNLISVCFVLSLAAVVLGFLYTPLGAWLGGLVAWPLRLILWVIRWLAKLPNAAVYTDSFYVVAFLVMIYILLGVFLLWRKRRPLFLVAGMAMCLVGALMFSTMETSELKVTVLDVGQGQSILLRSGKMNAMVDCGGDRGDADGERAARKLLSEGVSALDVLILTHYDADHTCGLEQILSRIEVAQILAPNIYDEEGNRERVFDTASRYGVPIQTVEEDLSVLFPDGQIRVYVPMSQSDDNTGLSALMSVQDYDILITGDMDADGEEQLLRTHCLPDIEVLVAGHHGSKHSTSSALLAGTQPETVIISVGDNHYGHPSQEVLDRIAAVGAVVYRTDLDGDITIMR